jgi:GNAT superfamily N-acetyltransferase
MNIRFLDIAEEAKIREALHVMNLAFYPEQDKRKDEDGLYERQITAFEKMDVRLIVAEVAGKVVGAVSIRPFFDAFCDVPCMELNNFAVVTEHQKRGVGTALLKFIDDYARANDFGWIRLIVRAGDSTLQDYYSKRGFPRKLTAMFNDIPTRS